jgi:hypothetical protein
LTLAGLLLAPAAHAETYPFSRGALLSEGCASDGLADAELRRAASSELSGSALELDPASAGLAASDALVTVHLPCAPPLTIELRATFRDIAFARKVELDELPRGSRARALALVVAELLTEFAEPELAENDTPPSASPTDSAPASPSSDSVPTAGEAPAARPASAAATQEKKPNSAPLPAPAVRRSPALRARVRDEERAHARSSTVPPRLGAGPELRDFFSGTRVLGVRAHVDWDHFAFGLSVLGRDSTVDTGQLSALIVHATSALRLFTLGDARGTSLSFGPRLGIGVVSVTAQPLAPNVQAEAAREPYLDGAAFADFGFPLVPGARCAVTAELGYALGVVALSDTSDVGHYGGVFGSALLDLAFEL